MAIVCCLCGKKQSGWISDFPFSVELSEYRICAECFNSFDKLVNAEKLEDVPEEVEYIKNRFSNKGPYQKNSFKGK